MPRLFKDKTASDQIRVWVSGCATGEEAYSIGILLSEYAVGLAEPPSIQVFATDLHENSLRLAREGLYPSTIVADVSEERLRGFFLKDQGGYRVRRDLREVVLFAPHDLLRDSPFSRLDLISCRNLLIYLNGNAQKRALDTFHFGLRRNGLLFLGLSESVDEGTRLFTPLNKKHRLYIRHTISSAALPGPPLPRIEITDRGIEPDSPTPHVSPLTRSLQPSGLSAERQEISTGALHLKLIERMVDPSVLVDGEHNVIHLSERMGRYLQFGGGESTLNLLRLVHPMSRMELRRALYSASQTSDLVEVQDLPLEIDGAMHSVKLRIQPAKEIAPGFALFIFEEAEPKSSGPGISEAFGRGKLDEGS